MVDVILVSRRNFNLKGVKVVNSLKNIDWSLIDCLIYNDSVDTDLDIKLNLATIAKHVDKLIYINNNLDPMLSTIFKGLDADIYDKESYLDDSDIVEFFIQSYKNTDMTIKQASNDVDLLTKNIKFLSESSVEDLQKLVKNESWIKGLKTSIEGVSTAVALYDSVDKGVVALLDNSKNFIDKLQNSNGVIGEELEDLRKSLSNLENKSRTSMASIYPPFRPPTSMAKILFVKSVCPCAGLMTLLLGYQTHLKDQKNKDVKILLLSPRLKMYLKRYAKIPRISPENIELNSDNRTSFFVTFEPTNGVMKKFFSAKSDVYIVVDMLYNDNMLEGTNFSTVYAVNGVHDNIHYDLSVPNNRIISSFTGYEDNIKIKLIKNFVKSIENARKAIYATDPGANRNFKMLDDIISIDK